MAATPEEMARRIRNRMNRCVNFNGFINEGCDAGVSYTELNGNTNWAAAVNLPCLLERYKGTVSCGEAKYPTREEAAAEEAEREAYLAAYMYRTFSDHICPECEQQWKGTQAGRCVYCEHCGHRLYQGTV